MKNHHIDCRGMGILQVAEILKDLESKGQVAEMTVVAVKPDGSSDGQWHSYFRLKDWNEFKNSINSKGSAIADVWITAVDKNRVDFLRESKKLKEGLYDEGSHHCYMCGDPISETDYEDYLGYCECCAMEIVAAEESDWGNPFRESTNLRESDNFWKEFSAKVKKYLPDQGQGDTKATQAVTATMKLVYKWFNDGDVFDNTYCLQGWANDLSSYANWLTNYIEGAYEILVGIKNCYDGDDYKALLKRLASFISDDSALLELDQHKAYGSIYKCDGPFMFREPEYEEDDEDYFC